MKPRSAIRPLLVLVTSIVLTGAPGAFATSGSWNYNGATPANNSWNFNASWLGTPALVPNGVGESAAFSFDINASRSITLDGDKTIGSLTLGDPTSSYFGYSLSAGSPAEKLIFDNTGSSDATLSLPVIATTVQNNISAPIQLNDNLVLSSAITSTSLNALTINSNIGEGAAGKSLTKNNTFLMTLNGANTYGGGTIINAGKITASNGAAFGIGSVTVANGAQANLTSFGATYPNNFSIAGIGSTETAGNLGAIRYGVTTANTSFTTSGTITVAGAARIGVSTGITGNMNGVLAGSAALELNSAAAGQAGTLNLNGTASGYGGTFTITQGRLNLGTNLGGNVIVANGASLGGKATIAGTLALGNATGGSTLYVDPTGALQVGGTTTVTGTNPVVFTAPLTSGSITILNSTGVISGTGGFALSGSANYHPDAAFVPSANSVTFGTTINTLTWTGASGAWDFAVGNWGAAPFYHLDNVVFDDGGATTAVTLASGVTVLPNTITVSNPTKAYTISGAGSIGGGASLTKSEAGSLTITTSNTFAGGTTLTAGSLLVSAGAALGTGPLTLSGGQLSSNNTTNAPSFAVPSTFSGTVILGHSTNTGGMTFGGTNTLATNTIIEVALPATSLNNVNLSGLLTDGPASFSLTKRGTGVLRLSSANTFDGGTFVEAGAINASVPGAFGTGDVTVTGDFSTGGQIYLGSTLPYTSAFKISGGGVIGPGTTDASGVGAIQFNSGGNASVTGPITLTGNARICGNTAYSRIGTFSGNIGEDASGPWLLQLGAPGIANPAGTIVLSGNNTYSGGTEVIRAIVRAYTNTAFGSGAVAIQHGNTFTGTQATFMVSRVEVGKDITLSNNFSIASVARTDASATTWGAITSFPGDATTQSTAILTGTVEITATPANGGHFAAQGNPANILRVNGAITSSVPVIISNGIVELGGGGTGYTELTQAKDTLRPSVNNGISTDAVVTLGTTGDATLDLNGCYQTLGGLVKGASSATVTNNSTGSAPLLTLAPTADRDFGGTFAPGIVPGALPFDLSIGGSAVTTLSGVSTTFAGTTTVINGGTLNLAAGATLGGAAVCNSGGTLAGTGTFGGALLMNPGSNLKVNTLNGYLKVTGTATVTGNVLVKLTGTPGASTTILKSTGTLTANASNFSLENPGGYASSHFAVIGNEVVLITGVLNLTWTGAGGNSWTVGGASNWTDGGSARAFLNGDAVTFNDTVITDQIVHVPGAVAPGTVAFNNTDRKFTLADDGAGQLNATTLTKSGTGTAIIHVPLILAGGMTLNAGNLVIQPSDFAASPTVLDKPISGAGTLTIANGGVDPVTISNSNTSFSGPVVISRGEVKATTSGALGTGTVTFGDADTLPEDTAKLTLDTGVTLGNPVVVSATAMDATLTGAGSITGAATLTKRGDGTLTINNANSFTGATTIVAGTLKCAAANAIGSGSTITLGAADTGAADSILDVSASIASPIVLSPLASSKAIIKRSGGVPTLSGPVNLNARPLIVEGSGVVLAGAISGSAGLTINTNAPGSPVVIAGETNSFGGNVQVLSGSVQASNAQSGTHNCIPDTASVALADSTTFYVAANETINGLDGTTSATVIPKLSGGTAELTVGGAGGNGVFSGRLLDQPNGTGVVALSLVKTGGGTQTLDGNSTATGYLRANGGTLLVNGSYPAHFSVAAGAVLGGSGTIGAGDLAPNAYLAINGHLAPGNGIGTLTLKDAVILFSGSAFDLQIGNWTGAAQGVDFDTLISAGLDFGGGGLTIHIDCTGLTGFTETARSFVIATAPTTIYPPGSNSTSFHATNFPGKGTWTAFNPDNRQDYGTALKLYYTPPSYKAWVIGYPSLINATALAGADPDHDGLNNLLEYVLGGNPTTPSASILPTDILEPASLVFSYNRNDYSLTDTTQVVQWSNDLVTWHDIPVGASGGGSVTIVDNGATDHVSVAISRTNELNGHLAARLKVTTPVP